MSTSPPDSIARQTKRKHMRFQPDPLDVAYIDWDTQGPFVPDAVALIVDEAPVAGVGLVLLNDENVQAGVEIRVKVGRIEPLRAEIRWREELAGNLIRFGLEFLE